MKLAEYIKDNRCSFITQRGTGYRVVFLDAYFEIEHERFCESYTMADFYAKKWVERDDDAIQ